MEIIDPRTAFATPDRFPDVPLHAEWPEDVLKQRPLDSYTALAAVTHDPKIDDFALKAALDAGCFYVGALGSRKTHAKRVERLLALGATADQIARIHAPIGLDIGASSPAEIAVAVLAADHQRAADARRRPPQEGRSGVKFGPVADRLTPKARSSRTRPTAGDRRFRKAHLLTADDIAELKAPASAKSSPPSSTRTISARTTPRRASPQGLSIDGIEIKPAATGRVNLHARTAGVFTVDRALIDAINRVDPAITIATVAEYAAVESRPDGGDGEDHSLRRRRRRWSMRSPRFAPDARHSPSSRSGR